MSIARPPGDPVPRGGVAPLDDLTPAIAAGDAEAFARWLAGAERRVRDSLRTFAARVDTESVLQETLFRVWLVAPRFAPDGRPDSLLRWAVRTARNLAVSELRRNRLDPTEIEAMDEAARKFDLRPPPHGGPDPLLRRAIEACWRLLPRRPAAAIAARLDGGGVVPDAELAEGLGMRVNTFLQNITRARRLLGECLRRRGVDLAEELS